MAEVSTEMRIEAPQEEVFALCADIPNASETVSGIEKIEMMSEGPVGIGTKWRETRIMFKKEATEVMWITEFEPPNRYVVEAESHGTHYHSEFRFEPDGDATRVTLTFRGTPKSLAAKMMSPMALMLKGVIKKCFENDLSDIKAKLEA